MRAFRRGFGRLLALAASLTLALAPVASPAGAPTLLGAGSFGLPIGTPTALRITSSQFASITDMAPVSQFVAPTPSSATGFIASIPIPASTTGNGTLIPAGTFGWAFSAGIGFAITGGGSSTDNTNAATGVFFTYGYK